MNSHRYYRLVAAFVASAGLAIAQSGSPNSSSGVCSGETTLEKVIQHSNASGSYTYPSFSPPPTFGSLGAKTIPTGNWTWNTALAVTDQTQGRDQEFWIDTPNLKNVNSSDIPYSLCNMAFDGVSRNTSGKGQDDNGDCLATLDQNCIDDFNKLAQTSATAQLGIADGESLCGAIQAQIISQTPDSCKPFLDGGLWGNAYGDGLFLPSTNDDSDSSVSDNTTTCNSPEYDGSRQALFGVVRGDQTFDQTQYDEDIYRVTPFLTIAMTRNVTPGSTTWSESRLICMRLSKITAGSDAPPPFSQATSTSTTTGKPSGPTTTPPPNSSAPGGKNAALMVVIGMGSMVVLSQFF